MRNSEPTTVNAIDLTTEAGRLEIARQLYLRFCEDMMDDPSKARARLTAGIQVAIRDAIERGATENLALVRRPRVPNGPQMTFIPLGELR